MLLYQINTGFVNAIFIQSILWLLYLGNRPVIKSSLTEKIGWSNILESRKPYIGFEIYVSKGLKIL